MAAQGNAASPEGTDKVIESAATSGGNGTDRATEEGAELATERAISAPASAMRKSGTANAGSARGLAGRLRDGREQFAAQTTDRARGLVTQGLERTAETLANVSKMVGDTALGIEERLGPEYGDYARRAAGALESVANTIAEKDPDELIDDTRNFVRNSPGIALAGAAVIGFVVARLIKSGTATDEDDEA